MNPLNPEQKKFEEIANRICNQDHYSVMEGGRGFEGCDQCIKIKQALQTLADEKDCDIKILNEVCREKDKKIKELEFEVEDWRNSAKSVMSEDCPTDEKHCTCVPYLKKELSSLRAVIERKDEALKDIETHSRKPFLVEDNGNNWKWLHCLNQIAREALNTQSEDKP